MPEKSSNESGAFRSKEENPDVSPLVAVVVVNVAESGNHCWSEGAERTTDGQRGAEKTTDGSVPCWVD